MNYFYVLLHLSILSDHWQQSHGPFGWWVWTEWHNGGMGFGMIRGHFTGLLTWRSGD